MSSSNQKLKKLREAEATQHDAFAALRFRDYRLFTIGRTLLFTGGQMQTVALGWELYERTHSALVLGGIGLAQVLPVILLTLVTGHVADKFYRKPIMLLSLMVLAVCSLGLAVISYTHPANAVFVIYTILVLTGVAKAFLKPASDALMFQLIPVNVFTNAATWNSTSFQIASVVGPALGGFAIALFKGATGVYLLAGFAGLLCFILITTISEPQFTPSQEPISLKALGAGATFVWKNQLILAAISLDMFAVLLGGAVALLPIFAKDILRVGPFELGCLDAAPSIGAFIMAVSLAHLPPLRKAGKALLWSVIGFGVVTIIFGLSRWYWLSLLMLAFSGALDAISVVIRHTLVQIRTPDHLRGRVSAINSVFISTSNELGRFESGLAAAFFGPVIAVVGGGIGTVLVAILAAYMWPEMRRLGSLEEYKK
ncbi:MFS transporter [Aetokthonos hydrillicola Thurmond2011]|jgi:MFS family permease|uniref:MFS transporter n=1 Tax=Aetokthonos hydrillicola Thurmond2011 TaxID=2712845 RepID=A0AAP5I4M5_9CYAN|nr:MFS transporter [Aetokthonos hydrillicola]MBO3460194.1 MFS transporter [Aetokthonos hydrillicola CCALA 1050]MBW4590539.1 MFS transporter [Aetokthonos hydrillicola CCALA 1050]MDR9893053.1 MFS transporter [Aetokthonos hydrillicola Thurmond2011]